MSVSILLAFVAATTLLALTPGPNMSLIVANTLCGGTRSGFITLAGTTTGQIILVTTAALGMSSVAVLMAEWFDVVRTVGALYLVILGVLQLRAWWVRRADPQSAPAPARGAFNAYLQGLLVSLSNPKVLLFLGAFLPQFVDISRPAAPQLAMLAALFVSTLLIVDGAYTYALGRMRRRFDQRRLAALDGFAGGLLLCGGLALAVVRRN